ncbi:MAG TPA: hypothetical protein VGM09_26495 [Bradyrhizobium sp.]
MTVHIPKWPSLAFKAGETGVGIMRTLLMVVVVGIAAALTMEAAVSFAIDTDSLSAEMPR